MNSHKLKKKEGQIEKRGLNEGALSTAVGWGVTTLFNNAVLKTKISISDQIAREVQFLYYA